jgi:tetraacyldisaccharide-1-P 4'-kinase
VFPDHHPYTGKDVDRITETAGRLGATALVTTEKDGVRLPTGKMGMPCYALAVEVLTHDNDRSLLKPVLDLVHSSHGNGMP